MDKERKYGFCKWTKEWVPRDEMYGATVKYYNRDGSEIRFSLRFSKDGWDEFMAQISPLQWQNDLRTAEELRLQGEID